MSIDSEDKVGRCIQQIKKILFTGLLLSCIAATSSVPQEFIINGVNEDVKKNIASRLETAKRHLGKSPSADRLQQFASHIEENVKQAIEPYGYFKSNVQIKKLSNESYQITVKPGPQMQIKHVNLVISGEGQSDISFIKLKNNFPLKANTPLLISVYDDAKKQLFQTAEKRGYLHGKLTTSKIKIDLLRNECSIVLHFDTGSRYFFGEVYFNKNPLNPNFLHRYTTFLTDKPFSTTQLLKLQDNLNNSDYFATVEIKPQFDAVKNKHIPIDVIVTPSQSKQYTYGIGYGTDTQVRGTLGVQYKRVNQYGHRFQGYLQGSPVQSNLRAIYIIPGKNPVTDEYHLSASAFRQNLDDVDSNALQFAVAYLSTWREWQRTLGLSALIEKEFNEENVPNKTTNWLYPTLNAKRIKADDSLNTTHGYSINFTNIGGSKRLFSDANFVQYRFDGKYIHQFNYRTRLLFRTNLGYTGINDIINLAPSLRFYTGGTQSVRGYAYQSLGPGKYLVTGGAECQFLIKDKWSFAVFMDAGDANNHFTGKLKRGVGIALVRSSPVGSINIGIAKPLDAHNKTPQFVFSMGPDLL